MKNRLSDRKTQQEQIEKYQREIEALLAERPDLVSLQRSLEAQLDKIGSTETIQGRANRAALAFALMGASFLEFRDGLEEYQQDLCELLTGPTKPGLRLLK
jgi:hypothetical protein